MTKERNWFDFRGTLTGNQYFLRSIIVPGIIASICIVPSFMWVSTWQLEGFEHATEVFGVLGPIQIAFMLLGALVAGWLTLSSTNKRLNAFSQGNQNIKIAGWVMALLWNPTSLLLWFLNRDIFKSSK